MYCYYVIAKINRHFIARFVSMGLILQMKRVKMSESSAIGEFDWFQLVCVDEYRRLNPGLLVSVSYSSSHPMIKNEFKFTSL